MIWKILSLTILQKKKNKQTNTKAYSEENTQGKAGQSIKDIMEL